MIFAKIILTALFAHVIIADQSPQCGDWYNYKDEKCIKVFDNALQSYEDAKKMCSQNEATSLVTIHSKAEQDFLFDALHNKHNVVNNIWIGANLRNNILKWTDNTMGKYINWDNGNPRNVSGYECVIMGMVEPYNGKWLNEPCEQKNMVVCQKSQNWLNSYLQQAIMELRKSFDNLTIQLENKSKILDDTLISVSNTNSELDKTKKRLEITENKLVISETTLNRLSQQINESIPAGTIAYFSNRTEPLGWLKANGQEVSRSSFANLFAIIGTTFGSGDGNTTFTLPDLRGEFIRGWSDGRVIDIGRIFGSFQWGSSVPFAGYINKGVSSIATAYQDRWEFSGTSFDDGFEINVSPGQTRNGVTYPDKDESNEVNYGQTSSLGHITSWNILKGTRPRNVALLACIKY